ncbi:nitric oxide reductase activation protein NorD [Delftia tsuruhatensis]|uniref:nitric oxide reductase activation protein NorD n=1 Tax=Delftia tsuruhatensis TaxID=180282 RepID=UPI0030D61933
MAIVSAALPEESRLLHTLGLLASGLARQPVAVQALARAPASAPAPGQAHALPPRAVLISQPARLLIPANLPIQAHLHAATMAHAAAHLRFSPAGQDSSALKPMGQAVVAALEDARVERLLCLQHPGVRRWFEACIAPEPDPSDLGFAAFMARLDRMLLWPERMDGNHWIHKARDLFENTATRHGLEDYAAFRAIASILANDLGQMRVRMDPQHHAVPSIYRDDNSYLWQHSESPQDPNDSLALQQTAARAAQKPPSPSAGPQPGGPEGPSPDLELSRHSYPEWDRRLERLKTDWCTVIDTLPAWQSEARPGNGATSRLQTMPPLPLPPARQLDRRQRLRRQWEGDDLDFNAALEVQVDRRLNLRPEPRLFMRAGKGPRPTSLLVLMDASESVNTPGPHGASLLELEKQAALMLAESRAGHRTGVDRLAIHAFSSNTRAEVRYLRLLDFGQPFAVAAATRLQALQGRHSTRLGAALRHASSLLAAEPAGQRHLLVITDGAPADIDVHDDRYLIEDARYAVQQARAAGIRISCLAVDSQADGYVRHIFGGRNYGIADDARHLPRRLSQMGARLAAGR